MKVLTTLRSSLQLLSRRDRNRLGIVTLLQMATAILDLAGVVLIGVVAALAASSIAGTSPPGILTRFVPGLEGDSADVMGLTVTLAVIAGFLLVSKSAVNMYFARRILKFLAHRQSSVSGELARRLFSSPLVQLQQRSSQETVYALTTGVHYATMLTLGNGAIALSEISLLALLGVGLLIIDPGVTLISLVYFTAVGLMLQKLFARWAFRLGSEAAAAETVSIKAVQEGILTYRETLVTDRRSFYTNRFEALRETAAMIQADGQFLNLMPKYVFEVALVLGGGLLAAFQLLTSSISDAVTVIAVFLVAGTRIVPSMLRLHGTGLAVLSAAGQAEPTFELARELGVIEGEHSHPSDFSALPPEAIRQKLTQGHPDMVPEVVVSGVSFRYPNADVFAVSNVDLSVRAGTSLGIAGSTGSGKSTLTDLILGVARAESGQVTIGGLEPLEAIATWPGGLAYVPQMVGLVNGSIRDNVALGLPPESVEDARVWSALERAELATFLRGQRSGLETPIGEMGIQLSGGQRQRLGLARALYSDPRLLILDEATSALDAETEAAISRAIRSLSGEVTTITIAHRLVTIRDCDQIVYIDQGRVGARGTFEEVMAASADFRRMASMSGLS